MEYVPIVALITSVLTFAFAVIVQRSRTLGDTARSAREENAQLKEELRECKQEKLRLERDNFRLMRQVLRMEGDN